MRDRDHRPGWSSWEWEAREPMASYLATIDIGYSRFVQASYDAIAADDPFWSVVIGDPGVDLPFDNAVYVRGAMTLQALRNEVGDDAFWETVRGWAASKGGGNATTDELIAHAEQVSGRQLDELFETWLFTPQKPPPSAVSVRGSGRLSTARARSRAKVRRGQLQRRLALGRY